MFYFLIDRNVSPTFMHVYAILFTFLTPLGFHENQLQINVVDVVVVVITHSLTLSLCFG